MLTYDGTVPGPTLHLRPGDRLRVHLTNDLDEPTNLHTHGFEVSSAGSSDSLFVRMDPGESFDCTIELQAPPRGRVLVPPAPAPSRLAATVIRIAFERFAGTTICHFHVLDHEDHRDDGHDPRRVRATHARQAKSAVPYFARITPARSTSHAATANASASESIRPDAHSWTRRGR